MGKKYIIELLDDCPSEFKGIIVFGLTPEGQISAEPIPVEDLTPYTEPDLEQEQEEQITKGDIVLIRSTPEVEIFVTYADEEYVSGIALTEVDGYCEIGDQYIDIRISDIEKTGNHYDIVSVLQKMREESNG